MNFYREYLHPVPVEFFDPLLGYGRGQAIGCQMRPDDQRPGKYYINMLVRLDNGDPVMVWQRYILPEGRRTPPVLR